MKLPTFKLCVAPTFTVIEGLVFGVFAGCVMSDAVTVAVPAVFSVTLKVWLPATNAPFAG